MDVSDADPSDGVMIALLPTQSDWCQIDLPHMTLVYAGVIGDLKPTDFNEIAKDAGSLAMVSRPIRLNVAGVEVFGEQEKVNVLKLRPTQELLSMRRFVEKWNASKHPFNPHCTIGPVNGTSPSPVSPMTSYSPAYPPYPSALFFNRVFVGWGEDALTFSMVG
jgi:2'-5' RNA ligase